MTNLTKQQTKDIELLKPFAKNHPEKSYDIVTFFKTVEGINVYHFVDSKWGKHHKIGIPVLAIIKNGTPTILDFEDTMAAISS